MTIERVSAGHVTPPPGHEPAVAVSLSSLGPQGYAPQALRPGRGGLIIFTFARL